MSFLEHMDDEADAVNFEGFAVGLLAGLEPETIQRGRVGSRKCSLILVDGSGADASCNGPLQSFPKSFQGNLVSEG